MQQAIPTAIRRMVLHFGAAATVAGLLTPVFAQATGFGPDARLIAEHNRLLMVYAAIAVPSVPERVNL